MKLLFDQNLSFKLARQLDDLFPDPARYVCSGSIARTTRPSGIMPDNMDTQLSLKTPITPTSAPFAGTHPKSSGSGAATAPQTRSRPCCDEITQT